MVENLQLYDQSGDVWLVGTHILPFNFISYFQLPFQVFAIYIFAASDLFQFCFLYRSTSFFSPSEKDKTTFKTNSTGKMLLERYVKLFLIILYP